MTDLKNKGDQPLQNQGNKPCQGLGGDKINKVPCSKQQ